MKADTEQPVERLQAALDAMPQEHRHEAYDDIAAVLTALAHSEARERGLREALEPFSLLADGANMNDPLSKWLTVAHVQDARAALTNKTEE